MRQNQHDDTIIARVRAGDTEAFGELVRAYEKPVYNLMLRQCGSREAALELAQETFLRAFEKLDCFRTGRSFFSWLYAVGINLARDHARRNGNRPDGAPLEPAVERRQSAAETDQAERMDLKEALASLPLELRETLLLHHRDGFTMKEIAAMFSLTESAVKMRSKRGMDMLRSILE